MFRRWVILLRSLTLGLRHDDLPGYRQLDPLDRLRVDTRAAALLLCSADALHMAAALLVWLLAGHILVWNLDVSDIRAALPEASALLWLLPWLAIVRRRVLRELLGPYWTEI